MLIVAGITLKSLEPRVWDVNSPYYLSDLRAVMLSYADVHQFPRMRERMMANGIHNALNIPDNVSVFLDNGAFGFSRRGLMPPISEYEDFVAAAKPNWKPIPQDFIPAPSMSDEEQNGCMKRTMQINVQYDYDGFVPVIHISRAIETYISEIKSNRNLAAKPWLAIGGIVPNLLRAPKSLTHTEILNSLINLRRQFSDKNIHVFGIGGTSTLHLAMLLGFDSVDSSGWRNRAARGIILLPGSGERTIAQLGSWNGRKVSPEETKKLVHCACPACVANGIEGLKEQSTVGFRNRATHNLWILLEEEKWISTGLRSGEYKNLYLAHLDNTIYRPIIKYLVENFISD